MGKFTLLMTAFSFAAPAAASDALKVGDQAPEFSVKTHAGKSFSLAERKDKGWTILYFYPKASTPGCTKQACSFRDAAKKLRKEDAEIYGISTDTMESLRKFHDKYALRFDLLSDPDAKVTEAYGAKWPLVDIAKRWTFLIDPDLKIRAIDRDVDPLLDAANMAKKLRELKG